MRIDSLSRRWNQKPGKHLSTAIRESSLAEGASTNCFHLSGLLPLNARCLLALGLFIAFAASALGHSEAAGGQEQPPSVSPESALDPEALRQKLLEIESAARVDRQRLQQLADEAASRAEAAEQRIADGQEAARKAEEQSQLLQNAVKANLLELEKLQVSNLELVQKLAEITRLLTEQSTQNAQLNESVERRLKALESVANAQAERNTILEQRTAVLEKKEGVALKSVIDQEVLLVGYAIDLSAEISTLTKANISSEYLASVMRDLGDLKDTVGMSNQEVEDILKKAEVALQKVKRGVTIRTGIGFVDQALSSAVGLLITNTGAYKEVNSDLTRLQYMLTLRKQVVEISTEDEALGNASLKGLEDAAKECEAHLLGMYEAHSVNTSDPTFILSRSDLKRAVGTWAEKTKVAIDEGRPLEAKDVSLSRMYSRVPRIVTSHLMLREKRVDRLVRLKSRLSAFATSIPGSGSDDPNLAESFKLVANIGLAYRSKALSSCDRLEVLIKLEREIQDKETRNYLGVLDLF